MDVKTFVLPNKVKYLEYVHNTYHPAKIQKLTDDTSINKKRQRMHQMLVNRYMDTKTPYRGLLLYHELGTGKTMTSIGVIDKYIGTDKNIFVLLPASLRNNFIKELLIHSKFRRFRRTAKWSYVKDNKNITFYIKDGDGYWVSDHPEDKNGKTYKELPEDKQVLVDKVILSMINASVTFIHYNGLTKELLNKYKGKVNHDKLKEWCLKDAVWSQLDGSKGIKKLYGYQPPTSKKTAWVPEYRDDVKDIKILNSVKYEKMTDADKKHIDKTIDVILQNAVNFVDLINVPNLKVFDNAFSNSVVVIDEAHKFIRMVSNERDTGTVLYNYLMDAMNCRILLLSGTPIINKPFEVANLLNLVRGKTKVYSISGKDTSSFDNAYMKYVDTIETFKNKTSITLLPRNFVKEQHGIKYEKWNMLDDDIIQKLTNHKNKVKSHDVVALPTQEEQFENMFLRRSVNKHGEEELSLKNNDMFMRRIHGLISFFDRYGNNYPELYPVVYKKLEMSDHQFNIYMERKKFEIELEAKKKKQNKKNLFDDTKGIFKAYTRMMCNFVFPASIKRQFPHDVMMDGAEDSYSKVLENSMEKFKKIKHAPDDLKMYSPKYVEIIKDIGECNGKALVYSQFRTVEGVGMLKIFLNMSGYKEVTDIRNEATGDDIGKRFMVLDLDKDKAQKQIEVFNNKKNNLYGENIKVLIITESGSEGISLKHTRLVCILEPYWNMILMKQVIGRAVRDGSHLDLPEEERNVRAYVYIMVGTAYQAKNNPTFRIKSEGLTTDQEILSIAEKKQIIIDEVMEMMRYSAVDCSMHAHTNKPEKGCYQWAINLNKELDTYKPDFTDETRNAHHKQYELTKSIRGTAIVINGVKYVKYEEEIYDYNAYMYAKKLIPAEITSNDTTTKYNIVDVEGDGACFYRALYLSLNHIDMLDRYCRCLELVNVTSETSFVNAMKAKIVANMIDSEYISNMYDELKTKDKQTYKEIIAGWDANVRMRLKVLPKTLDEFKTVLREEISKISCYATEIEISYIKSICDDVVNITVIIDNVKPSQTFNKNNVYLLNLGELHYNAVLPIY